MESTKMSVADRRTGTGATLRVWDEVSCRKAHEATLEILADTGTEVRHEAALRLLAEAGAKVDGTRVRFEAGLIDQALFSAPKSHVVKSRGRGEVILLEDGPSYFGTGSDCLFQRDFNTGARRRVRIADVEGMAALCEKLPNIDFVMSMGLPGDVAQDVDDVAQMAAMLRGCRKPIMMAPRTGSVIKQMKDMAELCGEADSWIVYGMPAPPLTHDEDGIGKMWASAENSVPYVYASCPSCGTTSPSSVTSNVIVSNAEVLSGLVIHQLINEGAPFVYGCGSDAMNMRTLVNPLVAPESLLGLSVMADLARFYSLPSFSYAGMTDSKVLDGQWAAESPVSTIIGALAGATLLHDVGYMESGLTSSYESIVFGDEMVGHARAFTKSVNLDVESLALDEIKAVGPGGNHLARPYTRKHHRSFWRPSVLDQQVHGRWATGGSLSLMDRVKAKTAELRESPPLFELDPATLRDLAALASHAEGR